MSSAPSPVTVLVEDIYSARKAIERGEDPRIVLDRLHHQAASVEERRYFAEAVVRVGVTPYTRKLWRRLAGVEVIEGENHAAA